MRYKLAGVATSLLLVGMAAGGCGSAGTEDGVVCAVGSEGCACTKGGGCDPGLHCESRTCVASAGRGAGGSAAGGDGGATGMAGDGGSGPGAGSGGQGGGNGCDFEAPEAGCEPGNGIFVAPSGDDEASGDKDAPVATIAKAVELAAGSGSPIFICNATYEESVVLGDDADDIAIHGGFACPDAEEPWTYVENERAVIAPAAPGYAFEADMVENLTVTDVELVAQDGAAAGDSSIAAFVSRSENVTFNRVKFVAGLGQDGDDGALAPFTYPDISELDGNDASGNTGGEPRVYACASGTTVGGMGGFGGVTPTAGGAGLPDHDGDGGEAGTVGVACNSGGGGADGADGPAGTNGVSPSVVGTVSSSGWVPTPPSNGEHGASGQGGGGGAGSASGGGGGGGAGACGGAGGGGGMPGGSSIALLSYQSTLVLSGCEFVTADAGDGGDGAAGQAGQQRSEVEPIGGLGGDGVSTACDGGNGGRGGDGGAGAGAAGGVSVGIVFTVGAGQAAPVVTEPTYTLGSEGNRGLGADGNNGIDGVSQEVLQLP